MESRNKKNNIKDMGRGLSQVLYNYMPGKTFDLIGGSNIGIVTQIDGEQPNKSTESDKLFRLMRQYMERWNKDDIDFEDFERKRDSYIFLVPKYVKYDIFPLTFKCPICRRVYYYKTYRNIKKQNPMLICQHGPNCNNVKLRQIYQVAIHECGNIKGLEPIKPKKCNCKDWKNHIILDDRRSQKISDFRWVCLKCKNESPLDYYCEYCEKSSKMVIQPHRAGKAFYIHHVKGVDVPDNRKMDGWKEDIEQYLGVKKNIDNDFINKLKGLKIDNEIRKNILKSLSIDENNGINFEIIDNNIKNSIHEYVEIHNQKHKMGVISLEEKVHSLQLYNIEKSKIMNRSIEKFQDLGIKDVYLIERFPVVTAVFGWSRVNNEPKYNEEQVNNTKLHSFKGTSNNYGKTPIFIDNGECEALMFTLDSLKVINWLRLNNISIDVDDESSAKSWIIHNISSVSQYGDIHDNDIITKYIYGLVHSMSHIVMKGIAGISGFELIGLSEYLFPEALSFIIYSNRTDYSIGGMHTLFENHLETLKNKVLDHNFKVCMHDPLCKLQDGACHACMYLPEICCSVFNKNVSRNYIYGNKNSNIKGFWEDLI